MFSPCWRIFSRTTVSPPQFIDSKAKVENSLVTSGCSIHGTVINSVLSNGVIVERGALVKDCVIMANTRIREGACVEYSIIDSNVDIEKNAVIGAPMSEGKDVTVVGSDVTISAGDVIEAGKIISK